MTNAKMLISYAGCTLAESDETVLSFIEQKTEWEIKNNCNIAEVPEGLWHCASCMIAAEFLQAKKAAGTLSGESVDLPGLLKQLQEGDTNIVFATDAASSAEQRLDLFIKALRDVRKQFVTYRRLKW